MSETCISMRISRNPHASAMCTWGKEWHLTVSGTAHLRCLWCNTQLQHQPQGIPVQTSEGVCWASSAVTQSFAYCAHHICLLCTKRHA
eukprot:1159786-Pelagomonas_calceolata.AAC.4